MPKKRRYLDELQYNPFPIGYDNNIYYSRNSMLPEVKVVAKGDPRKVNNDYYKAHAAERAAFEDRVARREGQGWVPKTMLGLATLPFAVEGAAAIAPAVGRVLTNPLVDAALTTHGAITAPKNIREGVNEIKKGNYGKGALDLGLTSLDLAGTGILLHRLGRIARPSYRARHAYNVISPVGYNDVINRTRSWLKDLWNNPTVDLANPRWLQDLKNKLGDRPMHGYLDTGKYIRDDVFGSGVIADNARQDAWAIYNRLPQQHGTYIKNTDGTYSYDMNKIMDVSLGTWKPYREPSFKNTKSHDFVTGAGGNLEVFKLINRDKFENSIMRIEDTWDLHPFRKLLSKTPLKWLGNIEAGKIIGGKPFKMRTDIPYHKEPYDDDYLEYLQDLGLEYKIPNNLIYGFKINN